MGKSYSKQLLKSFFKSEQAQISEKAIDSLDGQDSILQTKCVEAWHNWLKIKDSGNIQQRTDFEFNLSSLQQDFLLVAQTEDVIEPQGLVQENQKMSLNEIENYLKNAEL